MTDLRYAVRSLRGTPGFTCVALVVLTLGIGATTAIFSVVDAVVLRALPFDEYDRLVAVGEHRAGNGAPEPDSDPDQLVAIAPQNYMDWAAQQQVFESMAAVARGEFTLREPDAAPENLRALRVTAGFFDVLRIHPSIGRAFAPENEIEGQHRVAVLSDGLWRRRFGETPDIVGRVIPLDGESYEVIGVMPPGVTYPIGASRSTDLWVPYVVPEDQRIRKPGSWSRYLEAIARLKPGVSIDRTQAQMDQIVAAIEQANPGIEWVQGQRAGVRPLHDHLVGTRTKAWMLMLLGAVAVVLTIACANVANLLLARASMRARDVLVRAALGAGRWRLIRQSLAESLVLSIIGAALGTMLAWWGVQLLRSAMPEDVPRVSTIALDFRVLAAAAVLSLVTGLVFGVLPALQSSNPDLATSLKDAARGASAGRVRQGVRGALVVAEVALAVTLLVGASLFIGSFVKLMRIDPGFNPERVLTVFIAPATTPHLTMGRIIERLELTPGVVSAAVVSGGTPLSGYMFSTDLVVPPGGSESAMTVNYRRVTPNYHAVMGIPLRKGRLFAPTDRDGSSLVVLISESTATTLFPGGDAIGRVVRLGGPDRTIVGVVGDVRHRGPEIAPELEVYEALAQVGSSTGELVVRMSGAPYDTLPAVQAILLDARPGIPVGSVKTMEEVFGQHVAQRRLNMLLLGLFGVLGLIISAVGIYGVLAAVVSQRTREIGIRMALGATKANVVEMVLARTCGLVVVGLVVGAACAWYLRSVAESFLFGVEATNAWAFAAAFVIVLIGAVAASIIPAARAASVDPVVALRSE